jgi:hypothetical protein
MLRRDILPLFWTVLSVVTVSAATVEIGSLPEPVFVDREVSADAALPERTPGAGFRVFRLRLSFLATPSNNVQAAFGRDGRFRSADGALAAEETDLVLGWDRGEWFLRPQGLTNRWTAAAANAGTSRRRTFVAEIRLDAGGSPSSVVFSDSETPVVFPVSPFADSRLFDPGLWTALRATARGR